MTLTDGADSSKEDRELDWVATDQATDQQRGAMDLDPAEERAPISVLADNACASSGPRSTNGPMEVANFRASVVEGELALTVASALCGISATPRLGMGIFGVGLDRIVGASAELGGACAHTLSSSSPVEGARRQSSPFAPGCPSIAVLSPSLLCWGGLLRASTLAPRDAVIASLS